jgi:hypothetical protein
VGRAGPAGTCEELGALLSFFFVSPAGGGIHGTISTTQKRYPSKPDIEATGAERFLCPSVYFVDGIKELTCIARPVLSETYGPPPVCKWIFVRPIQRCSGLACAVAAFAVGGIKALADLRT